MLSVDIAAAHSAKRRFRDTLWLGHDVGGFTFMACRGRSSYQPSAQAVVSFGRGISSVCGLPSLLADIAGRIAGWHDNIIDDFDAATNESDDFIYIISSAAQRRDLGFEARTSDDVGDRGYRQVRGQRGDSRFYEPT